MKRILLPLLLLLAASAIGQQPSVPPYVPGSTPPIFPPDTTLKRHIPPDTKAPPPQRLSNAQLEHQIQGKLNSESELASTHLSVKSDANSVQLSGSVDNDYQHDLALRIAQVYAGDRKIVDKIKVER